MDLSVRFNKKRVIYFWTPDSTIPVKLYLHINPENINSSTVTKLLVWVIILTVPYSSFHHSSARTYKSLRNMKLAQARFLGPFELYWIFTILLDDDAMHF